MLFSTPLFIFIFLPIVLGGYFLLRQEVRNIFLVLSSLLFYAWGEGPFTLVLLLSMLINYSFGILIDKFRDRSKYILIIAIIINIGILAYYKYAMFFIQNIDEIL